MKSLVNSIRNFFVEESGQGLNEYAAMLAFVSLLVMLVFWISKGTFFGAIEESYSSVNQQLVNLNNTANNPPP